MLKSGFYLWMALQKRKSSRYFSIYVTFTSFFPQEIYTKQKLKYLSRIYIIGHRILFPTVAPPLSFILYSVRRDKFCVIINFHWCVQFPPETRMMIFDDNVQQSAFNKEYFYFLVGLRNVQSLFF